MKRRRIILLFFLPLIFFLAPRSFAQEYAEVTPDYRPEFPRDFSLRKDYKIQWWYFTGHLFDKEGREFGYELTFFAYGVQRRTYKSEFGVNTIYISHFAVSDIKGKEFYFSDDADAGAFGFSGASTDKLKVWVDGNLLEGRPGRMHIRASDKKKAIDLTLVPEKPVVLNGENGYSRKSEESPEIASIYFSYTSLRTEGELKVGGNAFAVSGKSWFDREISTRGLGEKETGWDWFSIQLDGGREIMLYVVRKKDGSPDRFSSGTFVNRDGTYRHLAKDDFTVTVLDRYKSKKTGARYPARWKIRIPSEDIQLTVTPLLGNQEVIAMYSTGNYYWEGTCKVEGSSASGASAGGRAYVEMTGY